MSECDCSCVSEYTNYLASVFALEIILQMSGHFSHRRRSRKDANNMSMEVAVIPGGPIREPPPTQPCTQMKERGKIVYFKELKTRHVSTFISLYRISSKRTKTKRASFSTLLQSISKSPPLRKRSFFTKLFWDRLELFQTRSLTSSSL